MAIAYDEALAERVRQALTGVTGVVEKKMCGGCTSPPHSHFALCFTQVLH